MCIKEVELYLAYGKCYATQLWPAVIINYGIETFTLIDIHN